MASGLVRRANRPNTWLHRPACKREKSLANSEPSTHGTKRTDRDPYYFVRFRGQSGHQPASPTITIYEYTLLANNGAGSIPDTDSEGETGLGLHVRGHRSVVSLDTCRLKRTRVRRTICRRELETSQCDVRRPASHYRSAVERAWPKARARPAFLRRSSIGCRRQRRQPCGR
jgi:hypothetical protein